MVESGPSSSWCVIVWMCYCFINSTTPKTHLTRRGGNGGFVTIVASFHVFVWRKLHVTLYSNLSSHIILYRFFPREPARLVYFAAFFPLSFFLFHSVSAMAQPLGKVKHLSDPANGLFSLSLAFVHRAASKSEKMMKQFYATLHLLAV